MSTRGVIYYNTGTSCAVRLLVSIASLRRYYAGPVTILSEGEESDVLCARIGEALKVEVLPWNCGVEPCKNRAYLAKTRYHEGTPYDTTIALDSDTLVVGAVEGLFDHAEEASFCVTQLGAWRSDGKIIGGRLRQWSAHLPEDVNVAIGYGPAINCGVVAFTKDAPIYTDWHSYAVMGRDFFIPDEVSCQLILHRYPHRILDGKWNRSCKHDDPSLPDTRIIHYHGRKHCRPGLPCHADKWVAAYDDVVCQNLADIQSWTPAGDRALTRHLRTHKQGSTPHVSSSALETREMERGVISPANSLRIVLGARKTAYAGWISTDKDTLNVTCREDWASTVAGRSISRLLAEHVWEHLTIEEMRSANRLAFEFLAAGGLLRIAVPDGFHPDPKYIESVRPGGSGPSAGEHHVLLNHETLSGELASAGFEVELVEYWDSRGVFHHKPWHSQDGHVKRSALHDRRNQKGRLAYTSLIIDAWKRATINGTSENANEPLQLPVYETDLWCRRGHFNKDQAIEYSEICVREKPHAVLEIGFCTGRSTACVLYNTADSLQRMVSIDINLDYKAPHGRRMARLLKSRFPKWDVIEAASREVLTPAFFQEQFPNGIDLAMIDGDHTYEGCMFDLEVVAPFLNQNGLIVVDDYRSGPPNGARIESVTRSVDDFLHRNSGAIVSTHWNKDGKGFCLMTKSDG